jgi:kynureninase
LFKLLIVAMRLRPQRRVVLSERGAFPTDLYIAQGALELLGGGCELRVVGRDQLAGALTDEVAVLMLTQVDFRSGTLHDLQPLTQSAHKVGALTVWDLSHSAGVVPIDLAAADADFAVGCGYKFLNGGPGAPAYLYVARRHQSAAEQPLRGWMGHARPFDFEDGYAPAQGVRRFLCGTAPVLSMVALEAALDVWSDIDIVEVERKRMALTDLFIGLMEERCISFGFTLASPRDAASRGSQVSYRHAEGYPIMRALIARGVIGDFRAPDLLRFGFAPLYVRYVDVWDAVRVLAEIMHKEEWDRAEYRQRAVVT